MYEQYQSAAYAPATVAQSSVQERLTFLRKVYGLLTATLMAATVGAVLGVGPLLPVVAANRFLFILAEIAAVVAVFMLRKRAGLNMVALFSFTTLSGLTLGPILNHYAQTDPVVIPMAFGLTAATFVGLTAYVVFSKKDFEFMRGFLLTGLIILVVGGIANIFIGSTMVQFTMSGAGVLLFSGFILYDTSNIMRRHSTDEYVLAALALYLDVLNLFVSLLNLIGLSRD